MPPRASPPNLHVAYHGPEQTQTDNHRPEHHECRDCVENKGCGNTKGAEFLFQKILTRPRMLAPVLGGNRR